MESSAINDIQRAIAHFSGYENEEKRRLADEQVRAFLGERLAELPESAIESLSPDERALYQRILYRCEFANQAALMHFVQFATPEIIAAVSQADSELVAIAGNLDGSKPLATVLKHLEEVFDTRDRAMLGK